MAVTKLTAKQQHDLKKFIKELESHKGRHTELVTVYIPSGYDITKIIQQLQQEGGTATNIKSASTRKNVIDALERMVQHLRLFKRTPANGLAVFSGNVAAEGKQDFQVWSVEPPIEVKTKIYRCDKTFLVDILREMLEVKEVYGLVLIDRREGVIATLKGKVVSVLSKHTSNVPGKMRAGGQCLAKDSFVQLADGRLPTIESVHNPHIVKSALFNNFAFKDSNITDKWTVKKNVVYKIITKNPRLEIQSSKDHLFYVASSTAIVEKPAGELKSTDYLIMPEKISVQGKIQKLSSKKYYNSFIITKQGRDILKRKRLGKKFYQKQLAKKVGVTQTLVSVYELGKTTADRKYLSRICDELDLSFEQFLENYTDPYLYRNISLPKELSEQFAQFIGYYVGDGCVETDRITFFEQNKQVALDYQKNFDKFFKMNSSYKFRKAKNYHQIRFNSRPLVRLVKNEFPEIKKTLDSQIPEKILKSPDKVVAAFLKGFFDAEGYVSHTSGIGLGINNKKLAQQIQCTLLRFSIISSLHEYDNRRNPYSDKPRFTISITEKQSLDLFKNNIGFTSSKKTDLLNSVLNKKSNTSYVRQIITPGQKVRKILEKAGYNMTRFPKVTNFFRNERRMSKQTFRSSILSYVKDKKLYKQLETIYNCPFLAVKINNIEKINKDTEMIDISVKNKNFIANCVLVHNSAARFGRIRENAAKEFYMRMAERMKEAFFGNRDLKGIIVGGPGPTKHEFIDGNFITNELKQKIIAVKDITYTDEFGLQELLDSSQDVLAKEELMVEKNIMRRFFDYLSKNEKMVSYGHDDVLKKIKLGAVDVLLLSESLDENIIEQFETEAANYGTKVQIISTDTREGIQLKEFGGMGAILRYEVYE